jgi:hypothetical protein
MDKGVLITRYTHDHFYTERKQLMGRPKTNTGLPAQQAFRTAERILASLEQDGADFVGVDSTHAYIWHKEQLVNLYDHQHLIRFLERYEYLRKRTENKMIVAAAVIMGGIKRCE